MLLQIKEDLCRLTNSSFTLYCTFSKETCTCIIISTFIVHRISIFILDVFAPCAASSLCLCVVCGFPLWRINKGRSYLILSYHFKGLFFLGAWPWG